MSDSSTPQPIAVRRAIEATRDLLASRPLLVVTDFDGTLSNIVQDPWGASILPLGRRALRRLAGTHGVHVSVLSGRTAADVARRVRVGNVHYLGNHGIERGYLPRGTRAEQLVVSSVDEEAHEAGHLAEEMAAALPGLVADDWLVVERKPPAVAFHFRQAPDTAEAGRRVREAADSLDPEGVLERFPGRRVLELRPFGAVAKGDALRSLLVELRPRAALILGDDVSDALAFAELRQAREAGTLDGLAVAILARAEVPPEVAETADFVLPSPAHAARYLAAVARVL
ncbi:MAG TPA: trehalose-phosphatase [Candidatus Limnocylindrales bacterium]|nr:trehalose-phosphatase [Candidatus Limnocylindrales bacterium]